MHPSDQALTMLSVEIVIGQDIPLQGVMRSIQNWFNRHHIEPTTFRYEFTSTGIVCRIDFGDAEAAIGFAGAFDGEIVTAA